MKNNDSKLGIVVALLALIITRLLIDMVGGVTKVPSIVIIIIFISLPILSFWYLKKRKKEFSKFKYKSLIQVGIYIAILSFFMCLITIIRNSFPQIWSQYGDVVFISFTAFFICGGLYITLSIIINRHKL